VALGIDPATKSALLSLNNAELRAKALKVVANLRATNEEYENGVKGIEAQDKLEVDEKMARRRALAQSLALPFQRGLKSDAYNLDFELRRRLGREAVAGIIGIPPSVISNEGAGLNILQLASISNGSCV
jgi:hypothetical protein